ncbi:helix-turn-helix domain-containing protein [Pseudomonas carnis]|uniref:helix-turn-helix transcriptional regulator n=1 Tax=Pseudomonas carnis TaxID=2487355 RepID=UPI002094A5BB|nr:helix-turn-helix domain-containing protein [Pseudomonas carnis]MCO7039595.1 helix-turn-helix domain-containing protein [Pseudomonas carnis]
MTDTRSFAERLLWARSEAGLTQKDLSEQSGISQPQIVRYEAGRSKPRLGGALKLARVLKMDAYDLMPELKKTTKEIEIQLSAEEAEQFDTEAEKLGISTEELMRKLTIIGLRMKLKDPETRRMMEEEFPGMVDRFDALPSPDSDGDLERSD